MRMPSLFETVLTTAAAASLFLGAISPPAHGQGVPPEISLADRVGVGARAMGMAGAYSAVADDATALFYNPAALARVERIELAAALSYHRIEDETQHYGGSAIGRSVHATRLNHLGFVYPFPTYRGSLVFGLAFNRLVDLDRDYLRIRPPRGQIEMDEETIIEDGSFNAWTAGLAYDAAPRVSLGASVSLLTGRSYREWEFHYENTSGTFEHSLIVEDADIVGVTAAVGALVRIGDNGRFSLAIDLPKSINLEGDASDDIYRFDGVWDDPDDADDEPDILDILEDSFFESDLTLPFSTTVGLAWRLEDLLVAADLQFTDWTDIDFEGPLRTPEEREQAYRAVLALRVGGEYAPPRWPVRLRAGLAMDPVPYKIILTDVFSGEYAEADFSPERWEVSLGAGVLLEESFTVDAAYSHRWFEREGPGISEGRNEDKCLLGVAFRY